jgi:hypothetical protein
MKSDRSLREENAANFPGRFAQGTVRLQLPTRGGVRKVYAAHGWRSELALVRDNTQ